MVGRIIEKVCNQIWHRYIEKLEFGLLPKEYNAKIHGPYSPARYYGKRKQSCFRLFKKILPIFLFANLALSSCFAVIAKHFFFFLIADVKFMALKMSEIPAWLRRRDMGPVTFVRLLARSKYVNNYERSFLSFIIMIVALVSIVHKRIELRDHFCIFCSFKD